MNRRSLFFIIPVHSWNPTGRFVLARKSACWVLRRERRFMSKRSCEAAESIEDASLRMARVNGRRMQKRSVRIALRRKERMSLSRPDGAYCFLHRAVPFSLQGTFRMIKCKERDYSREVFYMNKRCLSMTAVFTAAALLFAPLSGIGTGSSGRCSAGSLCI